MLSWACSLRHEDRAEISQNIRVHLTSLRCRSTRQVTQAFCTEEDAEEMSAMVTSEHWLPDDPDKQAELRTNELIEEFQQHYADYVNMRPEDADRQREIFEAWAIQKIAGLQLCVEHIAEQVNRHIGREGKS